MSRLFFASGWQGIESPAPPIGDIPAAQDVRSALSRAEDDAAKPGFTPGAVCEDEGNGPAGRGSRPASEKGERWITISGTPVKVDGKGEIVAGPEKLKKAEGKGTGSAGISITGNELGDYADAKELRQKAMAYYKDNLQGKPAHRDDIGEIRFSRKGLEETRAFSADTDKLLMLPALRDVIESGALGKEEKPKHDRKDGIVAFLPISKTVDFKGKEKQVEVLVAKDRNGNLYYDLFLDNSRKKSPDSGVGQNLRLSGDSVAEHRPASDVNIRFLPPRVNPAPLAFDASNRSIDPENGFMRVADCILTRESVDPYYGHEIPGWKDLGLDPDEVYYVYRPAEELEKALPTFQGLPLLIGHQEDSAEDPQKDVRAGAVMNDTRMNGGDMLGSISVMDAEATRGIESGNRVCLSSAYTYVPVLESGEWQGVQFSIRMTEIHGNHVALVEEGRVRGAVVADQKPKRKGRFMADIIDGLKRLLSETDADKDEKRLDTAEELGIDRDKACDDEIGEVGRELYALIDEMEDTELAGRIKALVDALRKEGGGTMDEDPDETEDEDENDVDERREQALTGDARPGAKRPAAAAKTNKHGVPYARPGKTGPDYAMDAATIARDAKLAALSELRSVHEAAREVRAIVGDVDPFSVTSADQLYKMALDASGFKASDYPSSAWRGMVHALGARAESDLAKDWDVASVKTADSMPEHLKNMKVRS